MFVLPQNSDNLSENGVGNYNLDYDPYKSQISKDVATQIDPLRCQPVLFLDPEFRGAILTPRIGLSCYNHLQKNALSSKRNTPIMPNHAQVSIRSEASLPISTKSEHGAPEETNFQIIYSSQMLDPAHLSSTLSQPLSRRLAQPI